MHPIKNIVATCFSICIYVVMQGQYTLPTIVKQNYTSFSKDSFTQHPDLVKYNTQQHSNHPDFGRITAFTPCNECVELYDKRDANHREFIKMGTNANHIFSQTSAVPLHYKDEQGQYIAIDSRMRPLGEGLYGAVRQPVPVFFHSNTKEIEVKSGNHHLQFGTSISFTFDQKADSIHNPYLSNFENASFTIGDDGIAIAQAWNHISLVHHCKKGSVQTKFILDKKPTIISGSNYFIITEPIQLKGIRSVEKEGDYFIDELGNYFGALALLDEVGNKIFRIEKAVLYDAQFTVFPAYYTYELEGDILYLHTHVPIKYITSSSLQYPITIDPWVTGYNKVGNFNSSGLPSANMQFTHNSIGSCDYHMTVIVPGKSDIINTYVDVEDENELSVTCGTPPIPAPGCMRHDMRHNFSSDECGTSTGLAAPPLPIGVADTPGTVTTDPLVIPGARSILIPGMLDCIRPQCPDYAMNFTLGNIELRCGETCGNKCATGNMWAVTIEARRLEGYMTPNRTPVCAGQPVVLTAYPSWGVPPYHYLWSTGDTTRVITIYPENDTFVSVRIFDTCNIFVDDDTLIEVIPSPPADAGEDKVICEGGSVSIGGSPTTSFGSSVSWQAIPATAVTYMSGTLADNPVISIPTGVIGTFTYVVRAATGACFRYDTVRVHSVRNPIPQIVPDTSIDICTGQSVVLSTTQAYSAYNWSNGVGTRNNLVSNAGSYFVEVTDSNGCKGSTSSVVVAIKPPFVINAYPDTIIDPEQTVRLYSAPVLTDPSIDSFYWSPATYLNCTNCENPLSTPEEEITYTLYVQSNGCWTYDSVTIRIKYPFDFFMPNAFTPNNDGVNDTYFMMGSKVLQVDRFMIYDRYGEMLWDSTEPWTGIYKGVLLNPGVYIYYIKVSYKGDSKVEKGSVTLVR